MIKVILILTLLQCTGKNFNKLKHSYKGKEDLEKLFKALVGDEGFDKHFLGWLKHEISPLSGSDYKLPGTKPFLQLFYNYVEYLKKTEYKIDSKTLEERYKLISSLKDSIIKTEKEQAAILGTLKIDHLIMLSYKIIEEKDQMVLAMEEINENIKEIKFLYKNKKKDIKAKKFDIDEQKYRQECKEIKDSFKELLNKLLNRKSLCKLIINEAEDILEVLKNIN